MRRQCCSCADDAFASRHKPRCMPAGAGKSSIGKSRVHTRSCKKKQMHFLRACNCCPFAAFNLTEALLQVNMQLVAEINALRMVRLTISVTTSNSCTFRYSAHACFHLSRVCSNCTLPLHPSRCRSVFTATRARCCVARRGCCRSAHWCCLLQRRSEFLWAWGDSVIAFCVVVIGSPPRFSRRFLSPGDYFLGIQFLSNPTQKVVSLHACIQVAPAPAFRSAFPPSHALHPQLFFLGLHSYYLQVCQCHCLPVSFRHLVLTVYSLSTPIPTCRRPN